MNQKMKHFAIIGSITCLIGALIMIIAVAISGFQLSKFDLTPDYQQKEEIISGIAVNTILTKAVDQQVMIAPSPDNDIHIFYYENKNETYQIKQQDKTVSITYHDKLSVWDHIINTFRQGIFQLNLTAPKLTILIPKENQLAIQVKNVNGSIQAKDITSNTLKFTNTNGSIKVINSNISSLQVTGTNGSTKIFDSSLTDLVVTTTNGAIQIKNTITNQTTCNNTNGSTQFLASQGKVLKFQSTNGSIKAEIDGKKEEYNILISKINGSSNIESQLSTNDQILDVKSTNGSIRITFLR